MPSVAAWSVRVTSAPLVALALHDALAVGAADDFGDGAVEIDGCLQPGGGVVGRGDLFEMAGD